MLVLKSLQRQNKQLSVLQSCNGELKQPTPQGKILIKKKNDKAFVVIKTFVDMSQILYNSYVDQVLYIFWLHCLKYSTKDTPLRSMYKLFTNTTYTKHISAFWHKINITKYILFHEWWSSYQYKSKKKKNEVKSDNPVLSF